MVPLNSPSSPAATQPADPLPFEPAIRSQRAWIILILITLAALIIDLGSKYLAFYYVAGQPVSITREQVLEVGPQALHTLIPRHAPVTIIPHILDFQLVLNAGAVFGAGQGKRWLFIGFTFAALAFALHMFARWTDRRDVISHASIALIIAGGLGNLYDRIIYACVRDFLHPLPTAKLPFGLTWPSGDTALWPYISNIADAFLIIGIAVLLITLGRAPKSSATKPA